MVRESLEVTSDQQQADDNVWDTTIHILAVGGPWTVPTSTTQLGMLWVDSKY